MDHQTLNRMTVMLDDLKDALCEAKAENGRLRLELEAKRKLVAEAEAIIEAAIPPIDLLTVYSPTRSMDDFALHTCIEWPARAYRTTVDMVAVAQAGPELTDMIIDRFLKTMTREVYTRFNMGRE